MNYLLRETAVKVPSHSKSSSILPYELLCQQAKPGDIVALSSYDLPSTVVKLATRSHYVHVAIILSINSSIHRECPIEDPILIAESHIDTSLPSLGTGQAIRGVQFQRLGDRLDSFWGDAWWVPLKSPLPPDQLTQMQAWLREIEQHQVPYDFLQAIGAGINAIDPIQWENQADYSALFCSELVTRALQIAGVVDETVNPSEQTPAQVMEFPCFESPILIKQDAAEAQAATEEIA